MAATLTQDQIDRIINRPHLPRADHRRGPLNGTVRSAAFHDQDLTVLTRAELLKRGETLAHYHERGLHGCVDIDICDTAADGSNCRFTLYLLLDARAEWTHRAEQAKAVSGR